MTSSGIEKGAWIQIFSVGDSTKVYVTICDVVNVITKHGRGYNMFVQLAICLPYAAAVFGVFGAELDLSANVTVTWRRLFFCKKKPDDRTSDGRKRDCSEAEEAARSLF